MTQNLFLLKKTYKSVLKELEMPSSILFKWLHNNYMKANTDKSHILLSGKIEMTGNIDGNSISSENEQVL